MQLREILFVVGLQIIATLIGAPMECNAAAAPDLTYNLQEAANVEDVAKELDVLMSDDELSPKLLVRRSKDKDSYYRRDSKDKDSYYRRDSKDKDSYYRRDSKDKDSYYRRDSKDKDSYYRRDSKNKDSHYRRDATVEMSD